MDKVLQWGETLNDRQLFFLWLNSNPFEELLSRCGRKPYGITLHTPFILSSMCCDPVFPTVTQKNPQGMQVAKLVWEDK